jgi:3-deoxy-D-arabino-heptulosonate 7-phosphate (DAHP) synthase class II
MQLKYNTVYAVDSAHETFIGTYRGDISNKYFPPHRNILWNVKVRIKNKSNKSNPILVQYVSINKTDIVYDLDKIKQNAKKAKESFEKRTLNMILKSLVNEYFEW